MNDRWSEDRSDARLKAGKKMWCTFHRRPFFGECPDCIQQLIAVSLQELMLKTNPLSGTNVVSEGSQKEHPQ